MIDFPESLSELHVAHEYWPPTLGRIYWVDRDVFGRVDKKPKRPYVVIGLPAGNRPDLVVVRRSTSAGSGVFHDGNDEAGLAQGWFCEVRNAPTALWTVSTITDTDVDLTEVELAYVMGEFL